MSAKYRAKYVQIVQSHELDIHGQSKKRYFEYILISFCFTLDVEINVLCKVEIW
jgi:hypothetical protein